MFQKIYAKQLIVFHPKMNVELHRDVGIIVVKSDFTFNEFVQPACLPTKSVSTGIHCYASGWGLTSDFETANKLMFAPLNIFDHKECYDELKKEKFYLDWTMFQHKISWDLCTSNRPKSVCPGDSGGPFICNEDGKAVVHGIASSIMQRDDQKCGNTPSFFTNVYLHLTFIQCVLNDYEGEECPELQFKYDKGMGIEESLGSRVCFCSWLCMILLFLHNPSF